MQKIKTEQINITPHISLMPKLGNAGYSVSEAISELVDNSVDAVTPDKQLTITIELSSDKISVEDDGAGMDKDTAAHSIRLGDSKKIGQKGEFGLGLKTACLSLGKYFTIESSKPGSNELYVINYDEDEWMSGGDWTSHPLHVYKKDSQSESGTKITIKNLKIKYYPNLATTLKEELGTRFAPEIENKKIRIKVNTKWCVPTPFELTEEGKTEFEIPLANGNKIFGWVGLLKVGSNKGNYGFNTFRRGRLITKYDKFGFTPHPEVRQLIGELNLDHLPVTHNKREFIKETALYDEALEAMREFMAPWVKKARSTNQQDQVDDSTKEKMENQLDNIAKAINRTPELKIYAAPNVLTEKEGGDDEAKVPDLNEIEQRDRTDDPIIAIIEEEPVSNKLRNPKKTHLKKKYSIRINGKIFKFKHSFQDFKDPSFMKTKVVTEAEGIEVFSNTAFPAFGATRDLIFYATFHIAEALAEIMVEQKNESPAKIVEIRDLILKQTSYLMRQIDEEKQIEKEEKELQKKLEEKRAQKEMIRANLGGS